MNRRDFLRSLALLAGGYAAGVLSGRPHTAWAAVLYAPPPRPAHERPRPMAGLLQVACDRRVLRLALATTLLSALDEPFLGFTIAYLQRVRGQSQALATGIAAASMAGGLAAYVLVARRHGRSGATERRGRSLLLPSSIVVCIGWRPSSPPRSCLCRRSRPSCSGPVWRSPGCRSRVPS